ncbi:MAG: hypothetical protein VKK42_13170 [Lyngbya sp.]|nr:hypothetical protein [Lyngbya sp.]
MKSSDQRELAIAFNLDFLWGVRCSATSGKPPLLRSASDVLS